MSTSTQKQMLPHSADSERAVLGAILLDQTAVAHNQAAGILVPDDFFLDSHRRIFACMADLAESGRAIDFVTVAEELGNHNELELIGGAAYLSHLTDGTPNVPNIEHYCRIVKDKAVRRQLAVVADLTHAETLDDSDDTETLLGRATDRILDLGNLGAQAGPLSVKATFEAEYGFIDGITAPELRASGISTGFSHLDALTSGLKPSNLILIAGRPSMGKTAFATALTRHVGLRLRLPVLFFSLEMSRREVIERLVCVEARVNSHRLHGGLGKEEIGRVATGTGRLLSAPIWIDDSPNLTLAALRVRARRVQQEHGLALVIVDYIGLMTPPRAENRNQEISALSRGLKIAAKELDVPLVALSQLSRAPEQRGADGHRPQLSDLRDSGSLEQDADLVCFLYRPEYYEYIEGKQASPDLAGIAELIIAKQRNGPTGSVPLVFMPEWAGFAGLHKGGNT